MRSRAFYNEIDPFAAQWLRNLIAAGHIADGEVDERDIRDISPSDLDGFTQCHFFAGIGGWSLALRLAGWGDERPVWTGSCPCQPFSSAARGRVSREQDPRHLWPAWHDIISRARPPTIFGEQVASARAWLDGVRNDMEVAGYAFGAVFLPAFSVGADHARERIYFACHAYGEGKPKRAIHAEVARLPRTGSDAGSVALADGIPGRVGRLRAYGNAIVPQVAAEVIGAFMECQP